MYEHSELWHIYRHTDSFIITAVVEGPHLLRWQNIQIDDVF